MDSAELSCCRILRLSDLAAQAGAEAVHGWIFRGDGHLSTQPDEHLTARCSVIEENYLTGESWQGAEAVAVAVAGTCRPSLENLREAP